MTATRRYGTAILLILLAAFPWLSPPVYFVSFMFTVFMYITLSSSWNLVGGYAGYLSFGHVAFFGIGAYSTAMLVKMFDLSPVGTVFSTLISGLVSSVVAVLVGYPCLRLRGPYFAVITLCFAFVVQLAFKNVEIVGGADGLWLKSMDLPIGI
ncbi:MAG: branched-chain amino acid ABC transporter permease, partial [Desulfomonile tiedjei]|nr:branched-chain amino acid ABC transporter permease [Desulfomonile tiedjei]